MFGFYLQLDRWRSKLTAAGWIVLDDAVAIAGAR